MGGCTVGQWCPNKNPKGPHSIGAKSSSIQARSVGKRGARTQNCEGGPNSIIVAYAMLF